MKLQNLIIIFIIIIIPIVSIFSLYLNLETKTIVLQTDYDEKLIEATKEAMSAFEINTTEWNNEYSSLANSKRQDILSSVNVFITSLSDKLRIGGTSRESILTYVPAIVFTMYDGYYIYAPTYVPQTITDDNGVQLFYYKNSGSEGAKITNSATQNIGGTIFPGEPMYYLDTGVAGAVATGTTAKGDIFTTDIEYAKKTYKHILKTFVPYTTNYDLNGETFVINYTLDNYIRIYGENDSREGYIIENFYDGISGCRVTIPVNSVSGVKFDNTTITLEQLTENVVIKDTSTGITEVKTYNYIYNSNNDKRYYDSTEGKFFILNKKNEKVYLPEANAGETLAEYKKLLVRQKQGSWEYVELYQLLNGRENSNIWYYIDSNKQYIEYTLCDQSIKDIRKEQDCSAINYYVENCDFNYWLKDKSFDIGQILSQKEQTIINNINNNLNLSISNYRANSRIDYEIPELTENDWKQALSNISMIAFLQGAKIGLKTYNNYAVVSSTHNNEMVSEDSLYYIGETSDNYYHRYYCTKGISSTFKAYRNTEFKAKTHKNEEETALYYYKHFSTSEELQECFDCIVNRNNYEETTDSGNISSYDKAFDNAIARERYVQMQRTRLTKSNAIDFELEEMQVTYIKSGKQVTFTMSGGTAPYKYQIQSIDGLWGNTLTISGNTLTINAGNRTSFNIRFSDNAGNTKNININLNFTPELY